MKWSIHWPHSLLYWSFNLTKSYFIASPGFVNVFSISTWSFNLTIWTFKPIVTPTRYFYLKATLNISHNKWPHQMHWNMLGVFCFCHTILLYSEACSSGRGFNLFSLTKLQHTHCLASPKSSKSLFSLTRNLSSYDPTNQNRPQFV